MKTKRKKDIYQTGVTPRQAKQIVKNLEKITYDKPELLKYQEAYECRFCLTLQEHKDKCLKVKK